jgi:hypothetical protein
VCVYIVKVNLVLAVHECTAAEGCCGVFKGRLRIQVEGLTTGFLFRTKVGTLVLDATSNLLWGPPNFLYCVRGKADG